jgi:uncharacterized protein YeaC (DUF1315 family)
MKKIPRAEISTIKQMLYPEKKKSLKEWNKKNLKCLKDLEEKNKRIKEEKKNFISPEPYKIQKFKNIPSKLKTDTMNWINREQTNNKILPKTPNINQKRNFINNRVKINSQENTLNPIIKPLTSNNESRPNFSNKNEVQGEENIYNILNNKTTTMFDTYYANKLKEKNMQYMNNTNNNNQNFPTENINNINNINYNANPNNNINQVNSGNNYIQNDINQTNTDNYSRNETIEKLIKEYKEKYGSDEALENMINEYYGKIKSNPEKDNFNNGINNSIPKIQNNSNNNNNLKVVLPKIQKNYIRENRRLVIDNKVPIKHKQVEEPIIKTNKHKDYGKVPSYIKKYEHEREIKNEEIKRREEASKYPKGTKLLTEEERLNTLNGLIRNKKELTNQLEKMPITTRTNSVRIKKEELIKKLEELEKAIDMFSRKQVFIKI